MSRLPEDACINPAYLYQIHEKLMRNAKLLNETYHQIHAIGPSLEQEVDGMPNLQTRLGNLERSLTQAMIQAVKLGDSAREVGQIYENLGRSLRRS